ncbi:MAG: NTP transferase domain-containing protein, partial [Treponema sp.]|nr:NTP transferase domain-containing protein [Treponema sp.]
MKLFSFFGGNKKRTVVIVQCRLSSTRLPRKALLPLGGKTVLEWTHAAMKNVKADAYYLATDTDSEAELAPIAKKCKWELYAGSRDDVLERFCRVIEKSKAQYVLRATADNPFLFYEAAQELLDDFSARSQTSGIDYMTYTGLPHGSGVEVFKADSLMRAAKLTESDYDHEHVGPALYNHTDRFKSLFLPTPEKYSYPQMRTTIDTLFDYNRNLTVVKNVSGDSAVKKSYTYQTIIEAMSRDEIKYPILYIPSVEKGHGPGHLPRCLELVSKTGGDIYIPEDASLEQCPVLVKEALEAGLDPWHVVTTLDYVSQYRLCVVDMFQSSSALMKKLSESCCLVALDEGGNA